MHAKINYLFFIFIFLSMNFLSVAQYAPQDSYKINMKKVEFPGQFPAAGIWKTATDKNGFLWFTTNSGLFRYDGSSIIQLGINGSPSLPSLTITDFKIDNQNKIWLGFVNNAAVFDLEKWEIKILKFTESKNITEFSKYITAIYIAPNGGVYYGSKNGSIFFVKNDSLQLITQSKNAVSEITSFNNNIWAINENGQIINFSFQEGQQSKNIKTFSLPQLKDSFLYRICHDSLGNFLISTNYHQFYSGNFNELVNSFSDSKPIYKRRILLHKITPPTNPAKIRHSPFYLTSSNETYALSLDSLNIIELYKYNYTQKEWSKIKNTYPFHLDGNIYTINKSGENAFISSTECFIQIGQIKSPLNSLLINPNGTNSVRSIYKEKNTLYIGSYIGFTIYDLTNKQNTATYNSRKIYSQIAWDENTYLLADELKGFFWFEPKISKFTFLNLNPLDNSWQKKPTVMVRMNKDSVLTGSYHGLHILEPKKNRITPIQQFTNSDILHSAQITSILPSPFNNKQTKPYIITSNKGTFIVDFSTHQVSPWIQENHEGSSPTSASTISSYGLMSINEDIWIGTSGLGVVATDSNGNILDTKWLNSRLKSQIIFSLSLFGDNVYIGTGDGLYVWNRVDSTLNYYNEAHGMGSKEFNTASNYNDNQSLFLATLNGVVHFDIHTKKYQINDSQSTIPIASLTISNKEATATYYNLSYDSSLLKEIIIPSNYNYFSISFGSYEEKNSIFYYKLDYDGQWIELGKKRELTFANLSPGSYQLQLAKSLDGSNLIVNSNVIKFHVQPRLSQTVYFKIFVIFCSILLGGGLIWFIYRQKMKEEKLRLDIAGDLHDEVGSGLTRIWLQAQKIVQKAESDITNPLPNRELKSLAETSKETLSMMSDIIWAINSKFDTTEDLILRMRDYIYKIKQEINTNITLNVENLVIKNKNKMNQTTRQSLFLIFKEAITNAVKYGNEREIKILIKEDKKHFYLTISNGLDNKYKNQNIHFIQGGTGLKNIQKRVKKMKGTFTYYVNEQDLFILQIKI